MTPLESTRKRLENELKQLELVTRITEALPNVLPLEPFIISEHKSGLNKGPYVSFKTKSLDDIKALVLYLQPIHSEVSPTVVKHMTRQNIDSVYPIHLNVHKYAIDFVWNWQTHKGETVQITVQLETMHTYDKNRPAYVSFRQPRKYVYDVKLVTQFEQFNMNKNDITIQYSGTNEYPSNYELYWDEENPLFKD